MSSCGRWNGVINQITSNSNSESLSQQLLSATQTHSGIVEIRRFILSLLGCFKICIACVLHTEHWSAAEWAVLPLRIKAHFCDLSPLQLRTPLFFSTPLTALLRLSDFLARSAPFSRPLTLRFNALIEYNHTWSQNAQNISCVPYVWKFCDMACRLTHQMYFFLLSAVKRKYIRETRYTQRAFRSWFILPPESSLLLPGPCPTLWKSHKNLFVTFWVISWTDRRSNVTSFLCECFLGQAQR